MNKQSKTKQMQWGVALLVITIFFASCNSTPDKQMNTSTQNNIDSTLLLETQQDSMDATIHFLLDASAKDFYDSKAPVPVGFRNVQIKNLTFFGENNYMLCGQFITLENKKTEKWIDFATVKTSGYEQWIGGSGKTYCEDATTVSYKIGDLSSELKSRLDALQQQTK